MVGMLKSRLKIERFLTMCCGEYFHRCRRSRGDEDQTEERSGACVFKSWMERGSGADGWLAGLC